MNKKREENVGNGRGGVCKVMEEQNNVTKEGKNSTLMRARRKGDWAIRKCEGEWDLDKGG